MQIKVFTVLLSAALSLLGAYWLKNIYVVVLGMVCAIAFRSILAERYLASYMKKNIQINLVSEFMISVLFMASTWFLQEGPVFVIMLFAYIGYVVVNRKEAKDIWDIVTRK